MDSLQPGKQPSAKDNSNNSGGGDLHDRQPSGSNASASSHHQQHGERNKNSIGQPLSSSSKVMHFHDSFGDADSGVDYGPPIDLEEEEEHHDEGANTAEESKPQHKDDEIVNKDEETEDATTTITLEELEETVGLHEATLESLHDKLSKLNDEIQHEQQSSSRLQTDIELLNKKKIVLKKRTENNVQLVKELEGTLDKCLERLRRVMDVDDDNDVDAKEEVKIDDDDYHDQQLSENGHENMVMDTEEVPNEAIQSDTKDFEIIKLPISTTIDQQDIGSIAWPENNIKMIRKTAASLPFAFPVWRTSELSCPFYTNLDSPELLLDMMNTTVLEYLLCREEDRVEGCGQVHDSKVWGTSLDIMTHVKWEHLLPSLQRETVDVPTSQPGESRIDPNVQLCPYELGGTCADDRCPYQHLSRPKRSQEETQDTAQDDEYIKYHSLSKLVLPPSPFSENEILSGDKEMDASTDVDLKQPPTPEKSDEELDPSVETTNQGGFEENDDYVSFPTVTEFTDGEGVSSSSENKTSRDLEFNERFWWYSEHPFAMSLIRTEEPCDVFDQVVTSFGFRRNNDSLEVAQPCLEDGKESTNQQMELIVDARLIDLCRVCIHMGQHSVALTVLDTFQKSVHRNRFHKILRHARQEVESSINCNCSHKIFDTQLSLLVISRYIWTEFVNPGLKTDLKRVMGIVTGKNEKSKYDDLLKSIVSRSPKRLKTSSTQSENKWAAFERSLYLLLEKEVIVPFAQLAKGEEHTYLLNCITIGKVLESIVYELSEEHKTFSPLLHALEPIWATLQALLQSSGALSTKSDWLQPNLIVTVIIGPVIYACVSKTIAVTVPSQQHGKKATPHREDKCHPKHDLRTIANLTCLDKCIVGILKTLNKSSQGNGTGEWIELLLSPLHAISVGISMAVKMMDKTQMKLGYVLSKGRSHRGLPSMYAMSSMLWSQLIQLQLTFPAYTSQARYEHLIPSLAKEVTDEHQDIVSRLFQHGVILHRIVLPGDFQITTSSLSTKGSKDQYKAVWEEVKREIHAKYSVQEEQKENAIELDLVVTNYMKEYSCFPESLLLAGKKLTRLRMTNCGLKKLPISFGFCLSNIQVLAFDCCICFYLQIFSHACFSHSFFTSKVLNLSHNLLQTLPPSVRLLQCLKVLNVAHNQLEEFPDTVIHCKLLEKLDVSHNKLRGFPRDLALRLPLLQSFVVDNNPV